MRGAWLLALQRLAFQRLKGGAVKRGLFLGVGSLLLALSAQAAESNAAKEADAQANSLIRQGIELRRAGRGAEALDLFRHAHALAPSPRALGQLGLVEASTQLWLDAETHLGAALAVHDDTWIRKNRALIEDALREVHRHIGELAMTGPAGTDLIVDGRPVGTLPDVQPFHLPEGKSLVTANGNGFKQFTKTVVIQAGARTTLAIALEPLTIRLGVALAPPAPPVESILPASATASGTGTTWAGAALATFGAGLLTWGAIWIAVDDHPTGDRFDCGPTCTRFYTTRTAGWVFAGSGLAAIAGGVALVLVGRRRQEPSFALGLGPSSAQVRARF
jgi:hypothetical protein